MLRVQRRTQRQGCILNFGGEIIIAELDAELSELRAGILVRRLEEVIRNELSIPQRNDVLKYTKETNDEQSNV
jgi:hypothetical protein